MRTLTDRQRAALRAPGYATHLRVWVQDGAGEWKNLSKLQRQDWTAEAEWGDDVDTAVSACTVSFRRGEGSLSLSPWVEGSVLNKVGSTYSPLLASGRAFSVDVATVPNQQREPLEEDWAEVFEGTVDGVEMGEGVVTINGRDFAGRVLDTYIEEDEQYGADPAGVALQTVIQQLLTRWSLAHTLNTPVDPLRQVGRYSQKKESVLAAIRALVTRIGWDVKMRWVPGSGWRLTLFSPDRMKTTADWTMPSNSVWRVSNLSEMKDNVRNVVKVTYGDKGDRDAKGEPKRKSVTSTDPTSIALFGRRVMEIPEDATSNIDTEAEAERFADSAIMDLSLPTTRLEAEVAMSWHLESTDMVTVPAQPGLFTSPITAAVYRTVHRIRNGKAVTILTLYGKPTLSITNIWMRLDTSPGGARPQNASAPFSGPPAPSSVAAVPTVNGFAVSFVSATSNGVRVEEHELHISTSAGFTPDTSVGSATFKARGKTNRFDVNDLAAGTTYYARVLPLDAKRNYGTASAEFSLAPRYVEPRLLLPRCTYGSLPLNADFEALSVEANPPDGWTVATGTWGASISITADAYSGTRALTFAAATAAEIQAQPFTCKAGEKIILNFFYKSSVSGVVGTARLDFVSSSLSLLSSSSVSLDGAAGVWARIGQAFKVPSSTRYCRLSFSRTSGHAGTLIVDGVDMLRAPTFGDWYIVEPEGESGIYGIFANGWDNFNASTHYAAAYRSNDLGEVELRGRILASTPAPAPNSVVFQLPFSPTKSAFHRVPTASSVADVYVDASGYLRVGAVTAGSDLSLDGIKYTVD